MASRQRRRDSASADGQHSSSPGGAPRGAVAQDLVADPRLGPLELLRAEDDLQPAVLLAGVGGEDVERDRARGAAGLHAHDGVRLVVAGEVAELDPLVDEPLARAQEVLDLARGLLVGLQAGGEELLAGVLGGRRGRGGDQRDQRR